MGHSKDVGRPWRSPGWPCALLWCGSGALGGVASELFGATGKVPELERTLLTSLRGRSGVAINCGASVDLAP